MDYRYITARRDGPVEFLTLNRPDVRNAFNDDVVGELTAWVRGVAPREDVRVIVIAGAGPHFCAGADLAWMRRMGSLDEDANREDARRAADLFGLLDTLPQVTIARVHGAALGGGTGLACVCDVVVAAETAVFGFTEVRLGLVPAIISPFAVAKIGMSHARALFVTARRFDANHAQNIGLVHAVVAESDLDSTVTQYVRDALAGAPQAIATAKALLRDVSGRPPSELVDLTSAVIARQRLSATGQEGLSAFLERRSPSWSR